MIKVIAFDYAGVVAQGPGNWVILHLKPEDVEKYHKGSELWDTGQISSEEGKKLLGKLTNTPSDQIWGKFYENSNSSKEIVALITKLKPHYKIFLFSNFMADLLRKLLKKHGIEDLFDEVIISSDYEVRKPQKEFFDVLIEKSGVTKNEILFIDDVKENIEGGNDYGIKSILFTDIKDLETDLKNFGVEF